MYRVIKSFTDLHDNDHLYHVGDKFPREGIKVTQERMDELAGSDNKQNTSLIENVDEEIEADGEDPKDEVSANMTKTPAAKRSRAKTSEK